uniref:Uncharacterized protein n=1 Tax=Lepeophtheirus salmonis TaxID=72036 RepID=A0A0K2TPL7_LEPSM
MITIIFGVNIPTGHIF